ncbi:MAG: OB-fold nucleic acid binding domain-containing protein [Kiritimatiellae bacterium]|nr:OB-fold nucleic acid binding domain-containing protein [Kiritimatiellia bacterium]
MTNDATPVDETSAAVCPSCNRYIGPAGRCPYCHSDAPKPAMLRILRIGSVVLAVAGLVLLYLAVTHRELPVQNIGEITPLMNYAYVRVVGEVPRSCFVGEEEPVDYVSFMVKDATGSIRVKAQGEVALKLFETGRLPQRGARVDVAGSLNVAPGKKPEMRLQAPRQLLIGESQK